MATDVLMPQMGESIAEGTIVKWLKKVGDTVQRDEPLLEISTDKVDAEIPAPAAGVLTEILAKEGDTVAVNSVLGLGGLLLGRFYFLSRVALFNVEMASYLVTTAAILLIGNIAIGVSMAYSDAVVGNVGSRERFNYTALGDGANIASRLQDVAKSSGYPVVATDALVDAAGERAQWTPLGRCPVRGFGDLEVFGWRPTGEYSAPESPTARRSGRRASG